MLASLLAWSLVAGVGALMVRVLLSRWEVISPDGSREIEESTGHEVVKWGGRVAITAMTLGALSFWSGGVITAIGGGGGRPLDQTQQQSSSAPEPVVGTDSIRWDTRAGGAQSIQASTDITDALSDAGYAGNAACTIYYGSGSSASCASLGARNLEFTLDYDGLGTNAFIYGFTDTAEIGQADIDEQDFILEKSFTNMRVGSSGQIPLFYQWVTYAGRTATGGGGTGPNGVFTGPQYSKRMVGFRDGGGQDCRFTLNGSNVTDNNAIGISWDGTYQTSNDCYNGELGSYIYDFQVSRAYRWTVCLKSSSANNVADGEVAVWVHDLARDSLTLVLELTGQNKGYKALNTFIDIGSPTRTAAAWPGPEAPFWRQEVEYTYDHLAWQSISQPSCQDAADAWPGVS